MKDGDVSRGGGEWQVAMTNGLLCSTDLSLEMCNRAMQYMCKLSDSGEYYSPNACIVLCF